MFKIKLRLFAAHFSKFPSEVDVNFNILNRIRDIGIIEPLRT